MFTGIIQSIGNIELLSAKGVDKQIKVNTGKLSTDDIDIGDSISVSGVCLTAIEIDKHSFTADVSAETIKHTTFSELLTGSLVNLELALTPESRLGGHMVSGHVDGVARVVSIEPDGVSQRYMFKLDHSISHYVARKGSICIDGVSLTVNDVENDLFSVNLVPHTLHETTLKALGRGTKVNIEIDIIARYLERLISAGIATEGEKKTIDELFLSNSGILTT